jgi:hypothetical protein
VHVVEEVREAKTHCSTDEVVCDHQPDQGTAIVKGRVHFADQNTMDVGCVRSYLLDYLGWTEAEE